MRETPSDAPAQPSLRQRIAPLVSRIIDLVEAGIVLDYRCGAEPIFPLLTCQRRCKVQIYEPKIARFSEEPIPADVVFYCNNHQWEDDESIRGFYRTMSTLTGKAVVLGQEHPDVEPQIWLREALAFFDVQTFQRAEQGFFMVCYPLIEQLVMPDGTPIPEQ